MTAESSGNAKDIFLQAIEIQAPADRQQFFDTVCGDDTSLRRRVEALNSSWSRDGTGSMSRCPPKNATASPATRRGLLRAPRPRRLPRHWCRGRPGPRKPCVVRRRWPSRARPWPARAPFQRQFADHRILLEPFGGQLSAAGQHAQRDGQVKRRGCLGSSAVPR